MAEREAANTKAAEDYDGKTSAAVRSIWDIFSMCNLTTESDIAGGEWGHDK